MKIGQRFGRLTFIKRVEKNKYGSWYGAFKCDCGYVVVKRMSHVKAGNIKSCGCLNTTSNCESHTKLYKTWAEMLRRCESSSHPAAKYYGQRGITVCAEWHEYSNFKRWAITHGYKEGLTIERCDNNAGYKPCNCRWATRKEQQQNRRNTIKITIEGVTKTLVTWANVFGMDRKMLYDRARRAGLLNRSYDHAKNA